jgi:hypothetical protein
MLHPRLCAQRYLLHIYIYDSICWNFRPSLLLPLEEIAFLPYSKQLLLQTQKQVVAHAAVCELDVVSSLHASYPGGCSHFGPIVFNTFEAAVLILTICFQEDAHMDRGKILCHDTNAGYEKVTRQEMLKAVKMALARLQALANVNDQAAAGSKTLEQLYAKIIAGNEQHTFPP